MKLRDKNTNLTIRIIGWIQILGSFTGCYFIYKLLQQTASINGLPAIISVTGILVFFFSFFAGLKLLMSKNRKTGVILSLVNQGAQLFQWSFMGYGFVYTSFAELSVVLNQHSLNIDFGMFESFFSVYLNSSEGIFFKVNILAALLMVMLYNIIQDIRTNHPDDLINELNNA